MSKKPDKEIVDMPVGKLKAHPQNALTFGSPTPQEIAALAAEMAKDGQLEPIEITPKGVIISGHSRWEAAKKLGWKTVCCWVRHDLAKAGADAVVERLIRTNLHRRQLTPLGKARCYRDLKTSCRANQRLSSTAKGDLRDQLGKMFHESGRSLDRKLQLLDLPLVLQKAFEDGQLPLTVATRIAGLKKPEQEQIAASVQAGANPVEVAATFLPPKETRHRRVYEAVRSFIKTLARGLDDLEGRTDQVGVSTINEHRQLLEQVHDVIGQWLAKADGQQLQNGAAQETKPGSVSKNPRRGGDQRADEEEE